MDKTAVGVVAVSGGYPEAFKKGYRVKLPENNLPRSMIFQAGTTQKEGNLETSGGRVIVVTSFGDTVSEAAARSYTALQQIEFTDMYYRKDIGYEF